MKSAIVTGSSSGIGAATAERLIKQNKYVVLNGVNEDRLADVVKRLGGPDVAVGVAGDVSKVETARRLIAAATAEGRILETVNNNAGAIANKPFVDQTEEDFDRVTDINLRGTFMVSREAARYWKRMAESAESPQRFNLINMTSRAALLSNPAQAQYAASKAGVIALTQVLARELRQYGVRCNTIAPRAYTPMMRAGAGEFRDDALEEWSPDYPARFVEFLTSEAAAGITGQIFVVHGWHVNLVRTWDISDPIDVDYRADAAGVLNQISSLFMGEPTAIQDFAVDDLPLVDPSAPNPLTTVAQGNS